MLKEITLPEIAENVESGTVVEILVSEGDTIEAEQPLVELETDKATFEVPSTESGVIKEIKVSAGDEVKVGEIIVTVETEGKEESKDKEDEKVKEKKPEKDEVDRDDSDEEETEGKVKEEEKEEEKEEKVHAQSTNGKEDEPSQKLKEEKKKDPSDIPAAPSVRRLAREMNVDLAQVQGSGPGGRITKEDVENHKQDGEKEPKEEVKKTTEKMPDFSKWGAIEKQPLSNVRRITAETMQNAWQTIPHVTQFDQANLTTVEAFMEKYAAKADKEGGKLTITAVLLKLCATALQAYPRFNASIDMKNKEIVFKKYVHIGVAVDTPQGLLVPVIRDVDKKSVFKLAVEVTEIAKKARDKKITPEELQGGNFTISNLGGIGGTNFTPIVYPPQVAILGVARANKQPIFLNGDEKYVAQNILPLSLSYDHRAIDGAEGARFLRWICNALEDPFLALMEGGL